MQTPAMPSCFVPGCKSGYNKSDEVRHFFKPPKDNDSLLKWQKAIPRQDRKLSSKCYVCDLHFSPELIKKVDKFIINETEVVLPRERWHLMPGAVPYIFPNVPKYLSFALKRRNLLRRETQLVLKVRLELDR